MSVGTDPLLEVINLKTYFFTDDGVVKAVDNVSFHVLIGEVLGLVGESGCGKSVTSLSIMRLVGDPGRIIDGKIIFEGQDLLEIPDREFVNIRGHQISIIFQEPTNSLDPSFTIGNQIAEVFQVHQGVNKKEAWNKAVDMLADVGIPDPQKKAYAYPHEISGGQAQRVMIAMALALKPKLLIADEPTTALDVTIQAQILKILDDLRNQTNTSVILISHDLGVIAETVDRVAVMYAGQIVEETDVRMIFKDPLHPYTQGLIRSIPILGNVKEWLDVIPGNVPNLINMPPGCRFAQRCAARIDKKLDICLEKEPDLKMIKVGHRVRCWLYNQRKMDTTEEME